MTDPTSDPAPNPTPAEALEAIQGARAQLAERVTHASLNYDLKYAALVGGMVAGQGLPSPWQILSTVVFVVALVLLLRGWVEKTGIRVTGYTPPRARWVAVGFGVLMASLMMGVMFGTRETGLWWIPVGAGVVSAGLALVASRLWWRVYAAESGMPR